jgi:hypothetical protein
VKRSWKSRLIELAIWLAIALLTAYILVQVYADQAPNI